MNKQFLSLITVFLLFGLNSFLFAQGNGDKEKEVLTTSELSQKTNAQDMSDAIKTVPGIYIRDGLVNIRDATSNQVLILIDGQRMNSAQSGYFDATSIPIDQIEKVEVLRGGNSARYGADAIGGVVNFVTKKATEKSKMDLGVRASDGSFNTQFYNIYTSNSIKDFNYYLSYKRAQTDGNFKYKEIDGTENTRNNNYNKADDYSFKVGYNNLIPESQLLLSSQITSSKTGTPGSVAGVVEYPIITPNANTRLDNMIYDLSYNQKNIFSNADLAADAYYHMFRTRYNDPDSYGGPTATDQKSSAYGLDFTQNYTVSELIALTYGYVYLHDHAQSTDIGVKDRNTHSAHGTVNISFKNVDFFFSTISIVPAVRFDAPSDFDKVFSPKLSLSLTNNSEYALSFDANVSRSYRAPTFNDLYWPEDAYTAGNPNLKPENGTSYEIGYGLTLPFLNKTLLKMNYFSNKMNDLIIWAPRADFKWTPTNVSESQTSGLETSIGTKFFSDNVSLEVNHTYMDARDKSTGPSYNKLLIYRPYHKLDINAGVTIDMVNVGVNYQYMSQRFVDVLNTGFLGDVSLWNANISVNPTIIGLKWIARLDFNNIFNKNYRLSDGYPMQGSSILMTIGFNLL
jgi:outer membrane cobalamin receptor